MNLDTIRGARATYVEFDGHVIPLDEPVRFTFTEPDPCRYCGEPMAAHPGGVYCPAPQQLLDRVDAEVSMALSIDDGGELFRTLAAHVPTPAERLAQLQAEGLSESIEAQRPKPRKATWPQPTPFRHRGK